MLGQPASLTAQMAAERHARFATEAAALRQRRLSRQPHPAPPCSGLAAQLSDAVLDLTAVSAPDTEPASTR